MVKLRDVGKQWLCRYPKFAHITQEIFFFGYLVGEVLIYILSNNLITILRSFCIFL